METYPLLGVTIMTDTLTGITATREEWVEAFTLFVKEYGINLDYEPRTMFFDSYLKEVSK